MLGQHERVLMLRRLWLMPTWQWLATLGVALALAVTACNSKNAGQAPNPSQTPPTVGVVVLQEQDTVLRTELPGRAAAFETSEVRPQVTGIIEKRLFTEGQTVTRGQTLYQIDARLSRAALNQAQADLKGAQATAVAAKEKANRFETLSAEGLVTALELTEVRALAGQAAAQVEQARAALETARIQLAFTQVPAPIDGRIGRSMVTTGALVTAGQPNALAAIQRLDPIFIDLQESSATITELRRSLAQGGMLRASTEVRVRLEDGSMYEHAGTVQFSEALVDPNTGSVTVRATFPNPNQVLLPGMYVRAVVEQGTRPRAILAPQQGIARDNRGQPLAYVVGSDDTIQQREVVVTRTLGEQWLIESGLSAGDRLVVEGTSKVRPGQRVNPVPFVAPAATPVGSVNPAGTSAESATSSAASSAPSVRPER
jgi:membrane fusion protein, multidrug efflux system